MWVAMKTLAKSALCALYKYSGILRAGEALGQQSFLAVLLFHRVTDEIPEDGLTVSTRRFAGVCRMLRRHFNVVPLAEIFRLRATGAHFPRRTLAITFDDCYRDNLFAARILAEQQLPACFFIPTAFVGTDHVFDWDRGLKRMANLNWDEVREMAGLGHEIGSHTVTHADMARVSLEQARHELIESKQVLEARLDRPVRWFAYPFGGKENFRADRVPLVAEAGYDGLVSGFDGFLYPQASNPIVPRVPVPSFPSLLNLEVHLRGGLDWYYSLRRRAGLL
jgi:peptidoglycan/xylan/chitin deacetylase (PgdA/CDA1 family)